MMEGENSIQRHQKTDDWTPEKISIPPRGRMGGRCGYDAAIGGGGGGGGGKSNGDDVRCDTQRRRKTNEWIPEKISSLPRGRTGGRRGYGATSIDGGGKSNGDEVGCDTRNDMFESFRNLDDAIAQAKRKSLDDNDDGSVDGDRKASLFEVSEEVCS